MRKDLSVNTYLTTLHTRTGGTLRTLVAPTARGGRLRTLVRLGLLAFMFLLMALSSLPQPAAAAAAGSCPAGAIAYRLAGPAGGLFGARVAAPPSQVEVPNPFCGIYKLIKPWLGGLVILSLLMAIFGFFGSNIFPDVATQMRGGIAKTGVGLFLLGIVLQPGILTGIAAGLGVTGITFDCP